MRAQLKNKRGFFCPRRDLTHDPLKPVCYQWAMLTPVHDLNIVLFVCYSNVVSIWIADTKMSVLFSNCSGNSRAVIQIVTVLPSFCRITSVVSRRRRRARWRTTATTVSRTGPSPYRPDSGLFMRRDQNWSEPSQDSWMKCWNR